MHDQVLQQRQTQLPNHLVATDLQQTPLPIGKKKAAGLI
jgi:hypothetical protein